MPARRTTPARAVTTNPNVWFFTVEDDNGNSYISRKFPSEQAAIDELKLRIEREDLDSISVDYEDSDELENLVVNVIKAAESHSITLRRAGVQIIKRDA